MKKYLGIIFGLFVGMLVLVIPMNANAMSYKDLGGKIYINRIDHNGNDSDPNDTSKARQVILFNGNGTKFNSILVNTNANGNIVKFVSKSEKKDYEKAISNKKSALKFFKDSESTKDDLTIKHKKNGDYMLSGPGGEQKLVKIQGNADHFTLHYQNGNESQTEYYDLAPQQYKFKW